MAATINGVYRFKEKLVILEKQTTVGNIVHNSNSITELRYSRESGLVQEVPIQILRPADATHLMTQKQIYRFSHVQKAAPP